MRSLGFTQAGGPLDLLCLGAHADDIEIGAGGTILRLLEEHPGSRVRWVVFSASTERASEAQNAAAAFLAHAGDTSIEVLAFDDSHFPSQTRELKHFFESLKSELDPDLILSHAGSDAHQDHRTISQVTWNTFRDHLILEYEIPKYDGDLGQPSMFVPLSTTHASQKIDILFDAFQSQKRRDWFDPDVFRGLLRLRGVECRAPDGYAEAFYCRKVVL